MRSRLWLIGTLALLLPIAAQAQHVMSDTQGLGTLAGTGARALGMGGAFTALADDPTAVAWNPAGLAVLERPMLLLVGDWYDGDRDLEGDWVGTWDPDRPCGGTPDPETPDPERTGCREKRHQDFYGALRDQNLAFLGGVYPFRLGNTRLVGLLAYRRLASFPEVNRKLSVERRFFDENDERMPGAEIDTRTEHDQFSGGVDAYSASLAAAYGSRLRVGVTVSMVDSDIAQHYFIRDVAFASASAPTETTLVAKYEFSDLQADIGVQWQVSGTVTLGAVYHLGFETDLDAEQQLDVCVRTYQEADPGWYLDCRPTARVVDSARLEWPDAWAVGMAWRPTARWTVALDYGRTEWSKGRLAGQLFPGWDESGNPTEVDLGVKPYPFYARQNDSYVGRVGVELRTSYLGVEVPLRLGYFREKQLLISSDFTRDDDPLDGPLYHNVTVGLGVLYKDIGLDLAWVHTQGEDRYPITVVEPDDVFDVAQRSNFTADRFVAALSYRF